MAVSLAPARSEAGENRKVRRSHLKWVRCDDIVPSPLGQRVLVRGWAERIANDFKLEAFGFPVLNLRDGIHYVVDGQHRLEAARIFGFGNDAFQCEVYEDLTQEEEAELFLERNFNKQVATYAKFKAAVHAQRPTELAVYSTVRALGLNVSGQLSTNENTICAVASLQRIHARIGPVGLSRTLRILRDAYGRRGLDAPQMDAMSLVLHRYDGQIDDSLMIQRLSRVMGGVNGILGPSHKLREVMGQPLIQCIAATIVTAYNKEQRTGKLSPWWRE